MQLAAVSLRVKDAAVLAAFYQHKLGMKILERSHDDNTRTVRIGYGSPMAAHLEILEQQTTKPSTDAYCPTSSRDFVYWKIGLTLADVKRAQSRLVKDQHVDVSAPQQFGDIGYLCHLQDPEGFPIELLQHSFESNFVPSPILEHRPLGSEATLAHITLRVTDAKQHLHFYATVLGMKLLSIQEVESYGFTLYFLAFTNDIPPVPSDLRAVGNREWLWKRPYTVLELQHVPERKTPFVLPNNHELGFVGLRMCTPSNNMSAICKQLERHQIAMEATTVANGTCVRINDPQGVRITISPE